MSKRLSLAWPLRQIAHRVSPLPTGGRSSPRPQVPWPGLALILETVAAEGLAGPARFGSYLLCRGERVLARGLFLGPGARAGDLDALEQLGRSERLEPPLTLEGLLKLIYSYVFKKRLPLVGFNLAAQLSRLAADWTAPESGSFYEGGVSLILWTMPAPSGRRRRRRLRNGQVEDGHRPRVCYKLLADGSVALGFAGRGQPDKVDRVPEGEGKERESYNFPGHFLPLERLAYGLGGKRQRTLEAACARFGIACPEAPPVAADISERATGCLARLEAAHRLYLALLERHERYGYSLPADRVYSPTSYAKASIEAIGIWPPLERLWSDLAGLGAGACAAYGGWSGVGLRSVPGSPPVPVRLIDEAGGYPVCAHAIGIWPLLCAERLSLVAEDPKTIEAWIWAQHEDTLRLSPELLVLCKLRPQGDVLPHRIKPSSTWLTTVAPLRSEESLWWPLPDLVQSFFETGQVPEIEACLRLAGERRLSGLRPIELPGLGRFDPNAPGADLFYFLAEGRQRLVAGEGELDPAERERLADSYKLWDNSLCSGIFLEVHPQEPSRKPKRGMVIGPDGFYETESRSFEEPGRWYFPPIYSLVTSAGRLLLYLAMREVRWAGGTVAYWDTDGLAVVATKKGGLVPCPGGNERDELGRECVRALSFAEVDRIRLSLERHSPYPPELGRAADSRVGLSKREPTLFRLEPENLIAETEGEGGQLYLHAVAAKRKTAYFLSRKSGEAPHPVSPSEFALGHLRRPGDLSSTEKSWIAEGWRFAALGGSEPDWLEEPALALIALTRQADLDRLGGKRKKGLRPWDTLVVGYADRLFGRNREGKLPRPVAPYREDFTVEGASWRDFASGEPLPSVRVLPHSPSHEASTASRPLYLRTLRSMLSAHVRAPERKALRRDGSPCGSRTAGLLSPAPTEAYATVPIGRETNYAEEAGVLDEPEYATFPDPGRDRATESALAILRAQVRRPGARERIAEALGISEGALCRFLSSGRARARTRERAFTYAVESAREALGRLHPGTSLPEEPEALLYLAARESSLMRPACEGCGVELEGRQRRWCERCRKRSRVRALVTIRARPEAHEYQR